MGAIFATEAPNADLGAYCPPSRLRALSMCKHEGDLSLLIEARNAHLIFMASLAPAALFFFLTMSESTEDGKVTTSW